MYNYIFYISLNSSLEPLVYLVNDSHKTKQITYCKKRIIFIVAIWEICQRCKKEDPILYKFLTSLINHICFICMCDIFNALTNLLQHEHRMSLLLYIHIIGRRKKKNERYGSGLSVMWTEVFCQREDILYFIAFLSFLFFFSFFQYIIIFYTHIEVAHYRWAVSSHQHTMQNAINAKYILKEIWMSILWLDICMFCLWLLV